MPRRINIVCVGRNLGMRQLSLSAVAAELEVSTTGPTVRTLSVRGQKE
ncbi:hypothetical protein ACFWCF_02350 [Rhodococcus sp. NPDC060090]